MTEAIISAVKQKKLIAIVRGVESEKCLKVAQALYEGGIRLMEITYDQKNPKSWQQTAESIGAIAQAFSGKMFVGAGTVTCIELVELTYQKGGQFIISPDVDVDVIRRTRELGMVSMPGALTPTEIMTAHKENINVISTEGVGTEFVFTLPLVMTEEI